MSKVVKNVIISKIYVNPRMQSVQCSFSIGHICFASILANHILGLGYKIDHKSVPFCANKNER